MSTVFGGISRPVWDGFEESSKMPETGLEMRMNCLPKSHKSKKNRHCIIAWYCVTDTGWRFSGSDAGQ